MNGLERSRDHLEQINSAITSIILDEDIDSNIDKIISITSEYETDTPRAVTDHGLETALSKILIIVHGLFKVSSDDANWELKFNMDLEEVYNTIYPYGK